ncbi:MAG: LPS export ABC transporter periplasmic protein LptC [bacterium]
MIKNNNIIKKVSLFIGIFFIVILAFFLILHYVGLKNKSFMQLKISKNYIKLKKINYKFFKHGKLVYEIFSKSLNYLTPKKNIIKLKTVKVLIFNSRNKPKYTITGNSGRLNMKTKNIRFSGNVIVKSAGGSYFKTDLLFYFRHDQKITAPNNIKLSGKKYLITGKGLTLYVKKSIFIIDKDVNFNAEMIK